MAFRPPPSNLACSPHVWPSLRLSRTDTSPLPSPPPSTFLQGHGRWGPGVSRIGYRVQLQGSAVGSLVQWPPLQQTDADSPRPPWGRHALFFSDSIALIVRSSHADLRLKQTKVGAAAGPCPGEVILHGGFRGSVPSPASRDYSPRASGRTSCPRGASPTSPGTVARCSVCPPRG